MRVTRLPGRGSGGTAVGMSKLFVSHSSQDDGFVHALQRALDDCGQVTWTDSRKLCGGDPIESKIMQAIEEAEAFAVVVSPKSLQSKWVGKELRHALEVQKARGQDNKDKYPVIPLSLDDTKLGVLEEYFGEEPLYIPVSSKAGGVEAALDAILVAMGKRLPAERRAAAQPQPEPLEELVLHLTDFKMFEQDGMRRASARASFRYEPAGVGQPNVESTHAWRLVAPIGPIEAEELRWYLEKYAVWPSDYFRDRVHKVEANLVVWGKLLYQAALPAEHTANVLQAWSRVADHAERRFSVFVDAEGEAGAPAAEAEAGREAATLLLGLPWELIHDGKSFLFQGAKPVRVRRRLPNTAVREVPVVAPPIRVLLVTARPEDEACGYIDHRASVLPLVQAMEALGGLVALRILDPPTLPALGKELERAFRTGQPYHVLHFDGHGVYDRKAGLGGLCFEDPQDIGKLTQRRHQTVFTDDLGGLLRDHRIPLVFLEACQTAQAGKASESVASEMLKQGVVSVVAMSHSVVVATASRFVEAFYQALAAGRRVGAAMLAGQRSLKDDSLRGHFFGKGEFRLQDWFVPVLFQEKHDPQLFSRLPSPQTREDVAVMRKRRMGDLPAQPETGFVGRSRELLALQRLLGQGNVRYAVIRGQGGEGKTALTAEFARWSIRSQQVERAAFVSVEQHSDAKAVLDALGRQLVGKYSVAEFDDLEKAVLPVERALREQHTLLVVDNMESVLLPPFVQAEIPEALSEESRRVLEEILALCARLNAVGETRLAFTSREALPEPFDRGRNRIELERLAREDAVKLVEAVLGQGSGGAGASSDAAAESIGELVDEVHGHARTLALLAPSLRSLGVAATRKSLVELMSEMERKFPGSREKSVLASVELSLRRMSPENQERARVLGVFHGAVQLGMLHAMMGWEKAEVATLASELVDTGLATPNPYGHLTLNPALCQFLRQGLDQATREDLLARWRKAMGEYVRFLVQEQSRHAEAAVTLVVLELPNLFALLEQVQAAGDAEATIDLTTWLYTLLQMLGRPRLLARVAQAREASVAALGETWNHARFQAQRTRIEQQLYGGQLRQAFEGAQDLLRRSQAAGEGAYEYADYDLAMACTLLGQVLQAVGGAAQALPFLAEAQRRFEVFERSRPGCGAARMASVCIVRSANCLRDLGRLDEAVAAYEEGIRRDEELGDEQQVAVEKGQLGTVRMLQGRYPEALQAHEEGRQTFARLGELGNVATAWHMIGIVHEQAGQPEAAEDAYRKSLAINVQLRDVAGQATTLNQLGNLYDGHLGRAEEAAAFLRRAADKHVEIHDIAGEGRARHNLAICLRKLRRLDEARQEIRRAIECDQQFGHASQPWKSWDNLADIENDDGNATAAAQAKHKAIECLLSYRRDGGENHSGAGRLVFAVTEQLRAGDPASAASLLQQFAAAPEALVSLRTFIHALQAILAGSRDRNLANAPDLDYSMAAEIILLIEALEKPG
jgi:tetratricopeptide (TPR) repeat protein